MLELEGGEENQEHCLLNMTWIPSGLGDIQLNKAGIASQIDDRCPPQMPFLVQALSPTGLSDSFLLKC